MYWSEDCVRRENLQCQKRIEWYRETEKRELWAFDCDLMISCILWQRQIHRLHSLPKTTYNILSLTYISPAELRHKCINLSQYITNCLDTTPETPMLDNQLYIWINKNGFNIFFLEGNGFNICGHQCSLKHFLKHNLQKQECPCFYLCSTTKFDPENGLQMGKKMKWKRKVKNRSGLITGKRKYIPCFENERYRLYSSQTDIENRQYER